MKVAEGKTQNIVGKNIRKYRKERKLSQKELSERLEMYAIYICRGSISRIEGHDRAVADFELKAMAEILKVPIDDLFEE